VDGDSGASSGKEMAIRVPCLVRVRPRRVRTSPSPPGTGLADRRHRLPEPIVRIAYITETFPPEINGVSLTAERALRHLRGAGHVVQLVRPRQAGEEALDSVDEWRTAGGPVPMVPELRFGWAEPAALRRRWRRSAPHLVHVSTPGPLGWAALRAARAEGIATSADFSINFPGYSRYYRLGALEPLVLAYLKRLHAMADRSFVPTPALARELAARGFERLEVIGRGVDAEHFSPGRRDAALRETWHAGDDDRVLLHVGRLAPEKNLGLALQTYETLHREHATLRMVVVGDGALRSRAEADYPEVSFVGSRCGDELARYYASADLFVYPSLADTFGNVTLEALASGLALVAFDTAAAALHVRDGESGCLAKAGDDEAFVAAARRALAASEPGGALRRAAREAALRADWDSVLHAFDRRLRATVADAAAARVPDAALA